MNFLMQNNELLHISLEAVEWRLVQVTFDLLRLKCVFF